MLPFASVVGDCRPCSIGRQMTTLLHGVVTLSIYIMWLVTDYVAF